MSVVEIEVDLRGRASLKSAGVTPGRYRVEHSGASIVLEPVTSFTRAELLAMSDPRVARVVADIHAGSVELESPADLP